MKLNVPTNACDPERLESFLSGDLSEAQERDFTMHLNSCKGCRLSLVEQAAEPEAWQEAEMLLKLSQFDSQSADGADRSTRQPPQIQNVLDALGPTDDPAMLGRLGGYEVSGVVGAGGMGVVLKATDKSLDRTVAIKVMAPHLATSGAARKRFAREAKAAAAVLHPNVIAIHSVSNDEVEVLPYLVMPYVRGTSLQRRLDREGPLPLREILRIGAQIAAGLAAAHAQGLVHRDIKPANILLEEGVERVTITDFGLARAVDDATITHSGMIAGTPQFMSPEQARGEAVDPRSDLFSLGSVLYAICTGRPPFRAETSYGVMRRITDDQPRPIREINPDVPEWLCQIINKLMSKRAADRYESAAEAAELFEACLAHVQQPTVARLPASLRPQAKGRRLFSISRRWSGVIAMIAALGLGLLGVFAWQATEAPDIAGKWSGPEWGEVVLERKQPGEYAGTYTDTFKEKPGTIEVNWSRLEGRYKGTWREGQDRAGKISLRLVDGEIRGAWTTSKESGINPGTPELADLIWKRSLSTQVDATSGIRVRVLLSPETHSREMLRRNIGFDQLSIMGSGVTGTIDGKSSNDLVAVMAHGCRLESFEEREHGGKRFWKATLFVPQDSKSDGSNLDLSQKRLDGMLEEGVHFWLDHHRDQFQKLGLSRDAAGEKEAAADAVTPADEPSAVSKGLKFLAAYQQLRELSLEMTEKEFLAIVDSQKLKVRKTAAEGRTTYSIPTGDGHTVIVMFGKGSDKCSGIQRLRGEENIPDTTSDTMQFSETQEIVLSADSVKFMLDFDSGKTMDMPATIGRPEQKQMDVQTDQVQPYHYPKELIGLGLQGVEVKESDWNASSAEVRRALAGDKVEPLKQMDLGPEKRPTYFFKTRDGALGVLQLLELVDKPKGIRLRYKTVVAAAKADKTPGLVTPKKVKAEFMRQAGDSEAANKLYDRIAADEHLLAVLTEALQFPERRGILYAAELWRVWREAAAPKPKEGGVPATDAAVCFYLGCDPASADTLSTYPVPADATEGFRATETMILSTAVRIELFVEDRKEPFDRLIAGWTAARADPWTRELAIETARECRLKAMVPVVRQMAADNKIEARFRAPAITLLAQFGGQDEKPLLRMLLGNGSVCHTRKLTIKGEDAPTATAQIRDVALGCLLLLDGADMRAAGFDELNFFREPLKPHEYFRGAPFGFFTAEKRNAVHAKFAALALSQDDPTKDAAGPEQKVEGAVDPAPQMSEQEKAVAKLVLVFFDDKSRRAVPCLVLNAKGTTFVITAGPATVVPDGTAHAVDRTFIELAGKEQPVPVEYDTRSTTEFHVYRTEDQLDSIQLKETAAVTEGDAVTAVSMSPTVPERATVVGLGRRARFELPDREIQRWYEDLIEVDQTFPEGTPLFKNGKLVGFTLLGTRYVREGAKKSYIVPAARIVELCARLGQETVADPMKDTPKASAAPKRLHQFPIKHRINAIASSPDGELIAITNSDVTFPLTADWKPVVEILDAKTGKIVASLSLATDEECDAFIATEGLPSFEVGPLVFSPDAAELAISTGLGQVKLFNARNGELIRSLDDEKARLADKATPEKLKPLPRAMGRIASLAFSPDGSLLATCGESFADVASHWDRIERGGLGRHSTGPGRLKVWDVKTGELKHDLAGHSHAFGVAFSPDGPWLASAGRWSTANNDGNGVLLWDLGKGAIHRTILIEANGGTHAVAFSPGKKLAAIGSLIFDKENDTRSTALGVAYPLSGITEWQQTIQGAAMPNGFLPDGKSIVVLSGRNSVRLIDAESGRSKHEIKAAEGSLWIDVALATKAGILVIAGAAEEPRGSVEIWEVAEPGAK